MRYFTWKLELVSNILWLSSLEDFYDCNLPQKVSLLSLTFLVTVRLSKHFQGKITAMKWKKSPKTFFTGWLLFLFFHWGRNLVLNHFEVCFRTFFRKIKKTFAQRWLILTKLVVIKNVNTKIKFRTQSAS